MTSRQDLLDTVARYYSGKLAAHGATPQGVDWNGESAQLLRFEQLTRIIAEPSGFSVNDLGCGYGALLDYLDAGFADFSYHGIDLAQDMLDAAALRYAGRPRVCFQRAQAPEQRCDYGIASGIFNLKFHYDEAEWQAYVYRTLHALHDSSVKGFAFNCLTSYSDVEKMRTDLYYADPCEMFHFCKTTLSRHVALLHDYGLYEFTILVRKTP